MRNLMIKLRAITCLLAITTGMMFFSISYAEEKIEPYIVKSSYKVNPGDILEINVWKEEGLNQEVMVRPDGGISFPLVGSFSTQNLTLDEIKKAIAKKLSHYISDPEVTVSAKQLLGNKVYVIGQVNKPGEYIVNSYVDVMQALSMAGGMTPYASVNNIIILRRDKNGKQQAIEFEYGDLEDGDNLQQNIILQVGDVVVVP
jgi:polysaccharide export outer membrane protein